MLLSAAVWKQFAMQVFLGDSGSLRYIGSYTGTPCDALADTVHSKYSFTYLLTYLLEG